MEILLGTFGFVFVVGLSITWARDYAHREQQYLDSLVPLVDEEKQRDRSRRSESARMSAMTKPPLVGNPRRFHLQSQTVATLSSDALTSGER
jgi:hypothetical protein